MAVRAAVVPALFFLLITFAYFVGVFPYSHSMTPSTIEHGSSQDLTIQLSSEPSSSTIKVSVHNQHPSQTYSLLVWDTPLDPQAMNMGALTLEDVETDGSVPGPDMKVNRLLPPPRDALIEIPPKSACSRDIALTSPWIPTDGKLYRVQVQGRWKAVWAKSVAQITDEELAAMTGDGVVSGEIQSGTHELQLTR